MSIEAIGKLIEDAMCRACAARVPQAEAAKILMRAEAALINAYLDAQDELVDACRKDGTAAVARRLGKSQRHVRRLRHKALNENGHKTA